MAVPVHPARRARSTGCAAPRRTGRCCSHNLATTLHDASIGYVAGIVLALGVACMFVLQRPLEQTFMPVALMLRSVPLVAMTPLITLIFGRGIMAVAVIGGVVCFFPALVNIMLGFRSTPAVAHRAAGRPTARRA